jgi:protein-tyrosine sulfotransferase
MVRSRVLNRLKAIFRPQPTLAGADIRNNSYVSSRPHIILGGCGRSGTTLVRLLLDSHPNICCGPESKLYLADRLNRSDLTRAFKLDPGAIEKAFSESTSRTQFIDSFADICCAASGKRRWAEKTPRNILHLEYIFRSFPQSKFIHVLRDGRDVACSLRTHPRHRVENGVLVPLNTWNPMEVCAARWRDDILASKPFWKEPRFYVLRYEELVQNARETLEKLFQFVGESWSDSLLQQEKTSSIFRDPLTFPQNPEALKPIGSDALGRWQRDMSADDKQCFKTITGELLVELGYASNNDW